ncbi:hypothetical protein HF086_002826 [Spodoptera exigua]|nr:hypothetical protein HF086_002826 [Spodoptera exigua]
MSQETEKESSSSADDQGEQLITSLRNDANLDLSADEEYEDLRAELLAYNTALASLTPTRRAIKGTECWKRKGICVKMNLCEGLPYLSLVPGCRSNKEVCCLAWNKFIVKDLKHLGIGKRYEFGGGQGIILKWKEKPVDLQKIVDSPVTRVKRNNVHKRENRVSDIPVMIIFRNNKE